MTRVSNSRDSTLSLSIETLHADLFVRWWDAIVQPTSMQRTDGSGTSQVSTFERAFGDATFATVVLVVKLGPTSTSKSSSHYICSSCMLLKTILNRAAETAKSHNPQKKRDPSSAEASEDFGRFLEETLTRCWVKVRDLPQRVHCPLCVPLNQAPAPTIFTGPQCIEGWLEHVARNIIVHCKLYTSSSLSQPTPDLKTVQASTVHDLEKAFAEDQYFRSGFLQEGIIKWDEPRARFVMGNDLRGPERPSSQLFETSLHPVFSRYTDIGEDLQIVLSQRFPYHFTSVRVGVDQHVILWPAALTFCTVLERSVGVLGPEEVHRGT